MKLRARFRPKKNETNASGVGISRCEVMPRTLPGSIYKPRCYQRKARQVGCTARLCIDSSCASHSADATEHRRVTFRRWSRYKFRMVCHTPDADPDTASAVAECAVTVARAHDNRHSLPVELGDRSTSDWRRRTEFLVAIAMCSHWWLMTMQLTRVDQCRFDSFTWRVTWHTH